MEKEATDEAEFDRKLKGAVWTFDHGCVCGYALVLLNNPNRVMPPDLNPSLYSSPFCHKPNNVHFTSNRWSTVE